MAPVPHLGARYDLTRDSFSTVLWRRLCRWGRIHARSS